MKDLVAPMEVFQVNAPGLPTQFPPLRASTEVQTNLPQEMTSFVGREDDLESVKELLGRALLGCREGEFVIDVNGGHGGDIAGALCCAHGWLRSR